MASERDITIVIRADGTAAIAGIQGVGDATGKLSTRTESLAASFQKNWAAITAGVTGAYLAFQQVFSLMENAAGQAERMDTLASLTAHYGSTAKELVATIQQVSRGLIGMQDAADVATDALSKGFTPEQVARMAKYAETVAETSGRSMTAAQAFREMEEALIVGKEKGAVKMFGTMIDLEAALGKTASTLTKAQKAQELFNLAMAEGERKQKAFGDATDSVADKMERFNTQVADLKLNIGGFANSVAIALFGAVQSVAGSVSIIISAIVRLFEYSSKITDRLGITKGAAAEWGQIADALRASGEDLKKQAQANYELALGIGAKVPPRPVAPPPPRPTGEVKVEEDKFTKISKIRFKTAEAYQKAYQVALAAVLKFKNDTAAIEEADAESFRKAMEAKIGGLSQFYTDTEILRREDLEKARKAAAELLQIQDDMIRQQADMRAASAAQGSEAGPGGAEIAGGLFDLASLADGTDPFTLQIERARLFWGEMSLAHQQGLATIEQQEAAHSQYKVLLDNQTNAMRFQAAAGYLSVMQGAVAAVGAFAAGKGKEMFLVSKAIAVAMAIVQAHVGAISAAAAVAGIPIVGPVLAAAAYAKFLTLGYINAGLIAATAIGQAASMKSGGGASLSSSGGGIALPTSQAAAPTTPEKTGPPVVNVYIAGHVMDSDKFAREIIPSITKAMADNANQ